ncbi:structural maintenance of chromosomes flexible hinge domain-containing protein GMI1 isoform X4 [Mangifera indica]|nr:structural maintenance of chromosomes flexible hinge domain-containing protein GMI1 isoform X4 [Mangifera indica]
MERPIPSQRVNKRAGEEDDGNIGRKYKFKILLPNGASVELTLWDPFLQMPFKDFIQLVKGEYFRAWQECKSMRQKRTINWNNERLYLEDAYGNKIINIMDFEKFKPHKYHILRLYDGSSEISDTFEGMWDLTPNTELLMELPEEYTFETALADLIDNSLQAVWTNCESDRRLISVDISEDKISIFDTGPGMDSSEENSIVKWGKMGASLNRTSKQRAIGGKPPYLRPFFGMFGYGGPVASMHLGRRAIVSSKTKVSNKVFTLHLERDALLKCSDSELTWRTNGGIRAPSEDESKESPHGSFTKVEIFEPKLIRSNKFQLQCKLKDIYFPYIQCDEVSKTGKTTTPIEFQVSGVDLAEIAGGEVAITNMHSCNGPEFVLQLHFSLKLGCSSAKSPGSWKSQEANARLKCVYFPVTEGGESIDMILDKLNSEGCGVLENYETFSRVTIRRLGRLLPDARWPWLPFMDLRQKKGDKAHLLKRCCLRVKCFIDTDAGFNPKPSKTDLAHQNPFTISLKNFGVKTLNEDKDINIEIYRDGKLLSPLHLEKDYQDWLLQMHDHYDEEVNFGADQPIFIISPKNKRSLGISSDVARVHEVLKRKGLTWRRGQRVKIFKGACAGVHNNNVYATIEYFLIEGLQGEAAGDARIICRPISLMEKEGCVLVKNKETVRLDIFGSLSLPIGIIDSGKCVRIDNSDWERQLVKQRQKAPAFIDLLNSTQCRELDVDGELPLRAKAGEVPPGEIVAVVRPANVVSSSASKKLDQRHIVKDNLEMIMEVKFAGEGKNLQKVITIYTARVPPTSRNGYQGLYIFELGCKLPNFFQDVGMYKFSFHLPQSSCKSCERQVVVKGSSKVGNWRLLSSKQSPGFRVRVGSCFPPLSIACYDVYDNRIPFTSVTGVNVKLNTSMGVNVHVDKFKIDLSADELTLHIEDILIKSCELDKIRPHYEATLVISSQDELVSLSIPCQVIPGALKHVTVQSPNFGNNLLPGSVVKQLKFMMFDAYKNHVNKGLEVEFSLDGFWIEDQSGVKRKVDNYGSIDLSGLLKVTAGYGKSVSLSILSDDEVVFKQEFQTQKRELRIVSGNQVPECCPAGSQLENVVFEVVDSKGNIDVTIHDNEKGGQSHTLTIRPEHIGTEDSIRYAFRHGRCTVPTIPLPQCEEYFCFVAVHSRYTEVHLNVKVPLMQNPKTESSEVPSYSDGKLLLLEGSAPFKHVGNLMVSIIETEKELESEICKYGRRIKKYETALKVVNDQMTEVEQVLSQLQASTEPHILSDPYWLTKEEMSRQIQSKGQSASAVLCCGGPLHESRTDFMEDIVGVVALIGKAWTRNLSRILAEYLGEDQMLALVCRSFRAACALEEYERNGEIDFSLGLHGKAAAHGKSIVGRFLVICLEDIRPYTGELDGSDPQRRLVLPDPILPCGNDPPGFMGYAVNMVDLDEVHVYTRTDAGHGLRETLFYRLFSELQVYRTREDMIEARACIKQGAVSLDGGILKENGFISLGNGNPTICFPVVGHVELLPSSASMEKLNQSKQKKSELGELSFLKEKYTKALEKAFKKFNNKKEKYKQHMDEISPKLRDYLECGKSEKHS